MIQQLKELQIFSGALGVVVLWVGVSSAMYKAMLGLIDPRPLSFLGIYPSTSVLFSSSLLISSFLFVNFAFYIKRAFAVNNRFIIYFLIGQVGQVITAVTPFGKDSPYKLVHTIAAFTLAISLPLLIRQFALSQKGTDRHILYVGLLRFEQLTFVVGIGLFVLTTGIAPLGEALPAIGFHIWILALTYIAYITHWQKSSDKFAKINA